MIVIGVLLLVGAGAVMVSVAAAGQGGGHTAEDLATFGFGLDDSAAHIFLYGMVTGATTLVGLYLTIMGTLHALHKRIATRRELRRVKREREALVNQRDELAEQFHREQDTTAVSHPTEVAKSVKA